jgi:hypothetical protein
VNCMRHTGFRRKKEMRIHLYYCQINIKNRHPTYRYSVLPAPFIYLSSDIRYWNQCPVKLADTKPITACYSGDNKATARLINLAQAKNWPSAPKTETNDLIDMLRSFFGMYKFKGCCFWKQQARFIPILYSQKNAGRGYRPD